MQAYIGTATRTTQILAVLATFPNLWWKTHPPPKIKRSFTNTSEAAENAVAASVVGKCAVVIITAAETANATAKKV
eukprot:2165095-Ditylum_brightwellii.AAC.1